MTPGLDCLLLLDDAREERAPFPRRVRLVHLGASCIMDQLAKVFDVWVSPDVIVDGGQLDELADIRDRPMNSEILVSDDGLSDRFGLIGGSAKPLKNLQSLDTTVDIKGHASCSEVVVGSTDVVQQTGQGPGTGAKGTGLLRELLLGDSHSVIVNSHRVVECFSGKSSLCISHGFLNNGVIDWKLDLFDRQGFRYVDEGSTIKDGASISRHAGPAIDFNFVLTHIGRQPREKWL